MEQEVFFSGYCRTMDKSRMVVVITEDRRLVEADCCYEGCPHTANCTIAQRIQALTSE